MKFVKDNGFDFTKEELKQVKSELSDNELEKVSGGNWEPKCTKYEEEGEMLA